MQLLSNLGLRPISNTMVVCDWCVMNLTHGWWVLIQSWMLDVVLPDPRFWNLNSTSISINVY